MVLNKLVDICLQTESAVDFYVTVRVILTRYSECKMSDLPSDTKGRYYLCLVCAVLVLSYQGAYTLVTLPRIVTPYRDGVDGTRARVTYQKLVTR